MANTPASAPKEKAPKEKGAAPAKKRAAAKPSPAREGRDVSPAERIQALEAEIARIRREEHDSRYHLITAAIAELNAMGYQYRLVEEGKPAAKAGRKQAAANSGSDAGNAAPTGGAAGLSAHYDEKKYCKLCKEGGHDQKAHKGEFQNRAFTNEEKAQRGVLPPELQESFLAEHPEAAARG